MKNTSMTRCLTVLCSAAFGASVLAMSPAETLGQDQLPNACPVDGCAVKIAEVSASGDELTLTFESNFMPDMSKNHIHVWWGELFDVKQVSGNAEATHGVEQGRWHPTDEYPSYTTQSAASVGAREDARTLCVTAADRNHDILDANAYHCVDVGDKL